MAESKEEMAARRATENRRQLWKGMELKIQCKKMQSNGNKQQGRRTVGIGKPYTGGG